MVAKQPRGGIGGMGVLNSERGLLQCLKVAAQVFLRDVKVGEESYLAVLIAW